MTPTQLSNDLGLDYQRETDNPAPITVRRIAPGYGHQDHGALTKWSPLSQVPCGPTCKEHRQ